MSTARFVSAARIVASHRETEATYPPQAIAGIISHPVVLQQITPEYPGA